MSGGKDSRFSIPVRDGVDIICSTQETGWSVSLDGRSTEQGFRTDWKLKTQTQDEMSLSSSWPQLSGHRQVQHEKARREAPRPLGPVSIPPHREEGGPFLLNILGDVLLPWT